MNGCPICLFEELTREMSISLWLGSSQKTVFKVCYGQIKDLTCFVHIGKGQFPLVRLALVWYVVENYLVGLTGLAQGTSRVTFLSARWPLPSNPQRLRAGLFKPSLDGG